MFSKKLTECRNNALIKKRITKIATSPANKVRLSSNIKVLKSHQKGQKMTNIRRILKKESGIWISS